MYICERCFFLLYNEFVVSNSDWNVVLRYISDGQILVLCKNSDLDILQLQRVRIGQIHNLTGCCKKRRNLIFHELQAILYLRLVWPSTSK